MKNLSVIMALLIIAGIAGFSIYESISAVGNGVWIMQGFTVAVGALSIFALFKLTHKKK